MINLVIKDNTILKNFPIKKSKKDIYCLQYAKVTQSKIELHVKIDI